MLFAPHAKPLRKVMPLMMHIQLKPATGLKVRRERETFHCSKPPSISEADPFQWHPFISWSQSPRARLRRAADETPRKTPTRGDRDGAWHSPWDPAWLPAAKDSRFLPSGSERSLFKWRRIKMILSLYFPHSLSLCPFLTTFQAGPRITLGGKAGYDWQQHRRAEQYKPQWPQKRPFLSSLPHFMSKISSQFLSSSLALLISVF